MIKKICLFILSFITILWTWISFADIINGIYYFYDQSKTRSCIIYEDNEMNDNKIIIENYKSWKIYELSGELCINDAPWGAFLLDKMININNINEKNIREKAIAIDNDKIGGFYPLYDIKNKDRIKAPLYIEGLYKIAYDLTNDIPKISLINIKTIRITWLPDFPWLSKNHTFYDSSFLRQFGIFFSAWLLTILIETITLFLIAKFCRKSWTIKNRKIILTWILASTVTLPLLWLVLPIFFSNYWIYVIVGEILVTIIETFIIKYSLKIERKMAILASVICNLCSFLIWLFIF